VRAAELLGADGPLARALGGYELRDAQLRMATMVEDALEHEGIALIEAGTGTGKTLAYLVPALRSGRKVVISTGTRTLQDQIMEHDLPLLSKHLGQPVRAACMKGLANYLCRRRYRELIDSPPSIEDRSVAQRLPMLIDWVARTERGDRAELDLAEDDPIWAAVQSGSDTRIGARCSHFEDCFVTSMRRRAEEAQLVVVNHHLFFADIATRGPHGGGVLPAYDAVIFDEAHQIEDVATLFFGVAVSEQRVDTLARDVDRASAAYGITGVERVVRTARNKAEEFFGASPSAEGRTDLPNDLFVGRGADRYHSLDAALEALELHAVANAGASEAFPQLARRASRLREDLARIADAAHSDVRWCERRGRRAVIGASPVEVSTIFAQEVIQRVPTVVLTSATLSTSGSFSFVKQRLGIAHEVDEAILASPFDYPSQAALYLPELPDPRASSYTDAALAEVLRLIALTGGGAFVLCTSVRMMTLLASRARPSLSMPVLVQGEAPKGALLDRFRKSGSAVLFATMSFWEGVDVPGDALRLVIVDKLPFDVPSDPLTVARCRRLDEAGESSFMRYLVPAAALTLKQGFGRLVRTRRDRGVVAILDSRIRSKGYGKVFLKSLPDAARCMTYDEVERFWRNAPSALEHLPLHD
jgi:ATP-dependent DNA helicase DinG